MNNQDTRRLAEFFEILLEIDKRVEGWKERLVSEPDGFPIGSRYTCGYCKHSSDKAWYTRDGIRCPGCMGKAERAPQLDAFGFGYETVEAWYVTRGERCTLCHLLMVPHLPYGASGGLPRIRPAAL